MLYMSGTRVADENGQIWTVATSLSVSFATDIPQPSIPIGDNMQLLPKVANHPQAGPQQGADLVHLICVEVFPLSFAGVFRNAYEQQLTADCSLWPLNYSSGPCCGNAAFNLARNRTEYQAFTVDSPNIEASITTTLTADQVTIARYNANITASPEIEYFAPYINMSISMMAPTFTDEEAFANAALFRRSDEQTLPGKHAQGVAGK